MKLPGSAQRGCSTVQFIDANIFLEVELKQRRAQDCKSYLRKVSAGETSAVTSGSIIDTISILMECAECAPLKIRKFLLSLLKYKGLRMYELTMEDRVAATEHMETIDLDFDDALVYAVMRSLDIREIVTMDRHFDKIPGIKRIEP